VLCECTLGATSAESEKMAGLARQRSLPTIVGLQAHNDAAILYARHLFDAIERIFRHGPVGEGGRDLSRASHLPRTDSVVVMPQQVIGCCSAAIARPRRPAFTALPPGAGRRHLLGASDPSRIKPSPLIWKAFRGL
jgi:hypothetical protein